jgi:hypothetical protein
MIQGITGPDGMVGYSGTYSMEYIYRARPDLFKDREEHYQEALDKIRKDEEEQKKLKELKKFRRIVLE